MTRQTWLWAVRLTPVALTVLWATMPTMGQGQSGQPAARTPPVPRPPGSARPAGTTTPSAVPPHVYGTQDGEWQTYGADLNSTRYSPLDQINADNFNKLEVAWRFKTDDLGPRPEFNFQVDAADGQRRAVLHRRHAPRGRRARRRHRRDAVDAQR